MSLSKSPKVVITGAGSGFGRALALEIARRGGRLILGDVNEAGLAETARLATEAGARLATTLRCDVTQLADIEALAKTALGGDPTADPTQDPIDMVVNNAGVSAAGKVGELPIEAWRWCVEVDLWGVIHGCHVFTPILKRQGSGHILNVASAAGLLSAPTMGPYNVAKAGVVALSETMAGELKNTGVRVTVLCPTFFKTQIVESGQFHDPRLKQRAQKLVAKGWEVEDVVRATLRHVERGDLYAVPMADARWMWRLKRLAPAAFHDITARVAARILK